MLTITKLEPQKRNSQRLNVYIDGEFAFGISRAAAPWLSEGDQLSKQKVLDLKRGDLSEGAYQRALNFLSYRSRSEQEITRNLIKHDIPEDIISEVMDKLRQSSLVDDRAFARNWIQNRIQFKPRGKRALAVELYQKGINQEIIDDELQELDESQLAHKCAQKKASRFKSLDWETFQKKMSGYLYRRGFPYHIIRETVRESWEKIHEAS